MSSSTSAPLPSYPGSILPIHDHPAWKHLSGTTMDKANLKEPVIQAKEPGVPAKEPVSKKELISIEEPVVYLPTGTTTLNRFSDITTSTRRASYASTTKSELRQSNQQLFEMLQNLQTELATHRAIMLDIQSRLSFIEQDAPTMIEDGAPEVLSPATDELKPPQRPPPPPPRRASSLIPPGRESQSWWQACQNFAENCDTPFNAQVFLKTPSRFEDFDFHFGGLATSEGVQPESPVEIVIDETPDSSPESESQPPEDAELDIEKTLALSPRSERQSSEDAESRPPSIFSEGAPRTSGLTMDTCEEIDNIIEQIVEFKKPTALPPLLLHPQLSGRTASILSVEEITALPGLPPVAEVTNDPQRHRKGIRSISSKWASLKGKPTEPSDYRKGFFSMR
ncbi:hypothetical protein BU25DRAFT_414658 [Macroventuria anomochaeta]|uniref:Uncharacterized protein n=1 Tax=Macroventuria anomochaeta TaxID=301207 RepID=A0ACB6RQD8_9PLEO|nr:uncharacterized protein BU25DRAFT_414658 [Macroventuria anomochaeta]KAF2623152.1 hypothetical protein BU25DRAFT_414658 [Macroventuria anomochaeta]